MLTVEVDSGPVETRNFTKRDTGQTFEFRSQQAYLHGAGKYPLPFGLDLAEGAVPFAPGHYSLDLTSFQVERGRLTLARYLSLTPVAEKKQA